MTNTILFDTDGVVIHRAMNFSERYSHEFGVPIEKLTPFYYNEFQLCLVGKADLKTEIVKYFPEWGWTKSVDELLEFWFSHERELDQPMLDSIAGLRAKGIACHQQTNNEKYRTDYIWNELGMNKVFEKSFAAGYVGYKKPELEFWDSIHEQLSRPDKKEVLVFDNEQKNIDSAREFGFQAELFTDYESYLKQLDSHGLG